MSLLAFFEAFFKQLDVSLTRKKRGSYKQEEFILMHKKIHSTSVTPS